MLSQAVKVEKLIASPNPRALGTFITIEYIFSYL